MAGTCVTKNKTEILINVAVKDWESFDLTSLDIRFLSIE